MQFGYFCFQSLLRSANIKAADDAGQQHKIGISSRFQHNIPITVLSELSFLKHIPSCNRQVDHAEKKETILIIAIPFGVKLILVTNRVMN